MKPPEWHSQALSLAYDELTQLDDPRESQPIILFVKHGDVHTRIFYSKTEDADDGPSQAETEVAHRIGALQGTAAMAYAAARLVLWNGAVGGQCWAISVSGAEAADPTESTWLQRIEFAQNGTMNRIDCWADDDASGENAINPWAPP